MERKERHGFFRAGDAAAIALVLLLAVLPLVYHAVQAVQPAAAVSVITESSVQTYPLSENREMQVTSAGHSLTIRIENGTVYVSETDCPNGNCAVTGAVSKAGQSIVCAPARVLVKIVGEEGAYEDDADVILP